MEDGIERSISILLETMNRVKTNTNEKKESIQTEIQIAELIDESTDKKEKKD